MAKKTESQEQNADTLDNRVVEIRRTTKVREGGRDFSFSAIVVVGDGNGRVGFGRGKAKEVVVAVQKASDKARKNMVKIPLRGNTLQYNMTGKYGATRVVMLPGAPGTGIIAGGAMRPVFEVLGVKNVIAKCIGSSNPNNMIRAMMKCLENMLTPDLVAAKRNKTVEEILG
ncbi:MAG: 30S ribosomal protein S5 [Gammaproteobacteria bacterium GWE2_42_36]|nr:MAG: 30S ribosomal protein S5 [Gammaproteobacteria bacterium GWE2_42_36]HCU05593.1 30S ribosomal protein S5 [Coxiellaceae bacterium]